MRKWLPKYDRLATRFAEQHFGGWDGVLRLFTYMKTPNLSWNDNEQFPADVYLVVKMNNEYHGLERHAHQYHVTEQYEYAYHHWLMAACWRHENMVINNFSDERHLKAVDFDLRCASYNKALHDWHWNTLSTRKTIPRPHRFGIKNAILAKKDIKAKKEIEKATQNETSKRNS